MTELTSPLSGSLRPAPHVPPFDERDVLTKDQTPLTARFYAAREPARGAVLIVPAMAVPQRFYAAFASWLATQGFHAVTFDYRGTGLSKRGPMRAVEADVITWAEHDTQAVLDALRARAPGLPITWIGHSLGGQIIPFVRDRRAVEKIITIATGSGYWRENTKGLRRKVWIMWWGLVPVLTPLFGYFPGKRLGMVGDLPKGVIQQWRRWCLDPEYAVGDGEAVRALYAGVTTPITALSFTDDEMMSAENTASIHGFYVNAPRAMCRIAPAELGLARIGHFGCFRDELRAPLWEARIRGELAAADS